MLTGAGSVVTAAVCGASVVGTGDVATVVVTGGTVAAGAGVVGGGDAGRTDAEICGGGSTGAGADATTVAAGGCDGGADTTAGTLTGGVAGRPGLGGATGVVVGPVPGSAIEGVIPPVIADNEIAVPEASTTTRTRPPRTRIGAPIAPRLPSSLSWRAFRRLCDPPLSGPAAVVSARLELLPGHPDCVSPQVGNSLRGITGDLRTSCSKPAVFQKGVTGACSGRSFP